jgi:hypothetical protein
MNQTKPSTILALAAWGSVLALAWLLALGRVQVTSVSAAAWIFFMFIAVGASAVASSQGKKTDVVPILNSHRLDCKYRVVLYDEIIKDLGLKQYDLVVFVKNNAGRWEIRTEAEMISEIKSAFRWT